MTTKGKWVRLSPHRVLIGDLMYFSRQVPSIPVQRRMNLAAVKEARERALPRPSWCSIFTKAFAVVANENPELRRAFLKFPWDHLYEHPVSVASVAVERGVDGEKAIHFAKLARANEHKLGALDRYIKSFARSADKNMGLANLGLTISRMWKPVRYAMWWWGLNSSGDFRSKQFGTYAVSVYSGEGAESLHPLSPLTFLLNYGVISADGEVNVRLIYDHRVLDGATVARTLAAIEAVLNGAILSELNGLRPRGASSSSTFAESASRQR